MSMTGGTAKLVKTTYPFTDKTKAVNLYVYYKSEQHVQTNKSTVTVGMYVTTPSGWDIGPWYYSSDSYVGTKDITFDGAVPNFSGTRWLVENKTFTVVHNADGTGKATIYWKWGVNSPWGSYVNPSGSFDITLPSIPRATTPTLSATSVQMGKSITITMNRAASSFTHNLKYTINGVSGNIASELGTSYTWTIPKDLVRFIENLLKATVTITCDTYSDGTKIGSKTASFTVTVPNASVPTLSASSVRMGEAVTITTNTESSYYTHILKYTLNGTTGTIATAVVTSKKWTVPDLVALIPNATSGDAVITCETYNGTAKVGTKTVGLKINAYAASSPTFSEASVKAGTYVTITTNRGSKKYKHNLTYSIGKYNGSSLALQVEDSVTWAVPAFLVQEMVNALSGTVTVTCETYNGTALIGTVKKTLTVTVPEASVPGIEGEYGYIGGMTKVIISTKSQYFTHDITLSLEKSKVEYNGVRSMVEVFIPLSFAAEVPNDTTGTIKITCVTKNGTAIVGTESYMFIAKIPDLDSTKPNFTITLKPEHNLLDKYKDVYVQRKSKVNVTFEAYSEYADIKSYSIKVLNTTVTGNPCTSVLLTRSGEIAVEATVTDSRGYSRTKVENIRVIPYAPPSLAPLTGKSALVCVRSYQDGTAYLLGEYALIQAKAIYSDVDNINTCTVKYRAKASSSAEYPTGWKLLEGLEFDRTLDDRFVTKTSYVIQLMVADDVGEDRTYSFIIPYVSLPIHEGEGGRNLGLGQYCDYSHIDAIDIGWTTYFNTGIGKRTIFKAPEGTDVGWAKGEKLTDKFENVDATLVMNYTLFIAYVGGENTNLGTTVPILCKRIGNKIYGSESIFVGYTTVRTYVLEIEHTEEDNSLILTNAQTDDHLITALYALI